MFDTNDIPSKSHCQPTNEDRAHNAVREFLEAVAKLSGIEATQETVEPGVAPGDEVVWVKARLRLNGWDEYQFNHEAMQAFANGPIVTGVETGVVPEYIIEDVADDDPERATKRLKVAVTRE